MHGLVRDAVAKIIRGAVDQARFDSRACHPGGEAARVMVAAIIVLGEFALRITRAAKFPAPDYERGLLQDALVVWGGEFGRTSYSQGKLTKDDYGRDHHPRCFTAWMAGAGVKPGLIYGATDDFGYSVADKPVHVHDLQATILQQLGLDHTRLTFRFQGRDYRLTDVFGEVVKDIL